MMIRTALSGLPEKEASKRKDDETMNFTAKDVAALREKTGCGMMDCKKALTESNGCLLYTSCGLPGCGPSESCSECRTAGDFYFTGKHSMFFFWIQGEKERKADFVDRYVKK